MPFLSVVLVLRNHSSMIEGLLLELAALIKGCVSDYEIVVVDNASTDTSVSVLRQLTGEAGIANLQVYALTKEVDTDTAAWVGLENALGDFVAVIDPLTDDVKFLPTMLEAAFGGADVVFAVNEKQASGSLSYRWAFAVFNWLYRGFNGIHLARQAPHYRIIGRKIISFILQHPQPAMSYRHLPATGGFIRIYLRYSATLGEPKSKRLGESIDRGVRLLVSTTRAPMRVVTTLSMSAAVLNLFYCVYVVAVAVFKKDVAPGWISLSLLQSSMFFLISLVLLVLGEYIINMASLSNEGPRYHVGQEFTSARMTRRDKLNVHDPLSP